MFPFKKSEKVTVIIENDRLIVAKENLLDELQARTIENLPQQSTKNVGKT